MKLVSPQSHPRDGFPLYLQLLYSADIKHHKTENSDNAIGQNAASQLHVRLLLVPGLLRNHN